MMKITILGSGTSTGIPLALCKCEVCLSEHKFNKRLRSSVFVEIDQSKNAYNELEGRKSTELKKQNLTCKERLSIIIDVGPDFRQQALENKINDIDAVLITHTHADHIFGLDDLRPFCFELKKSIPLYSNRENIEEIRRIYNYIFDRDPNYIGSEPARIDLNEIEAFSSFKVREQQILPIRVLHGKLEILGFRINNFAYITDCSQIPETSLSSLDNLELLILDGLRKTPHPTHLSIPQSLDVVKALKPKRTLLTHIGHDLDHLSTNKELRELSKEDVQLAFDGQVVWI